MTRVLVLDFDGTMTDAESEGRPFRDGYLDDLSILVGRRARDPEIAAIADEVERDLAERPAETPFLWMDRAVAPATVDPYLRMATIAHRVLDKYGAFANAAERSRLLGGILYKYNYAKTLERPVFRPGAGDVLRALVGQQVYVITNSDTEAVAAKLERLDQVSPGAGWLAPRVRGFARKFDLADDWPGVPAELAMPGLARPVLLRRRTYHDLIATCLAEAGGTWEELLVVGDIFELDLALPLAMGARIGLVAGARTPKYELDYVAGHPRGRVLQTISEVPSYAFDL